MRAEELGSDDWHLLISDYKIGYHGVEERGE